MRVDGNKTTMLTMLTMESETMMLVHAGSHLKCRNT